MTAVIGEAIAMTARKVIDIVASNNYGDEKFYYSWEIKVHDGFS